MKNCVDIYWILDGYREIEAHPAASVNIPQNAQVVPAPEHPPAAGRAFTMNLAYGGYGYFGFGGGGGAATTSFRAIDGRKVSSENLRTLRTSSSVMPWSLDSSATSDGSQMFSLA
jgi:hypothetical protein